MGNILPTSAAKTLDYRHEDYPSPSPRWSTVPSSLKATHQTSDPRPEQYTSRPQLASNRTQTPHPAHPPHSPAKYRHKNNLLIHRFGRPPVSGAVSNWIQMRYGMSSTQRDRNDMARKKKNRHMGRRRAQNATANVWRRREGGMFRGANLGRVSWGTWEDVGGGREAVKGRRRRHVEIIHTVMIMYVPGHANACFKTLPLPHVRRHTHTYTQTHPPTLRDTQHAYSLYFHTL